MQNKKEIQENFQRRFADWYGIALITDANLLIWDQWRHRDITEYWGQSISEFMPRQVSFGIETYCLVPLEGKIELDELRKKFFKRITALADILHYKEFVGKSSLYRLFNQGLDLMKDTGALTISNNTVERSNIDPKYLNELPFDTYGTILAKKSTKAKTSTKRGLGLSCVTTHPLRETSENIEDMSERLRGFIEYSPKDHEKLHYYHEFRTELDGTQKGTGTLLSVWMDGDSIGALDLKSIYSKEPYEIRDIALIEHLRRDRVFVDDQKISSIIAFIEGIKVVPVDLLARYFPEDYQGYMRNNLFTTGGRFDLAYRGLYLYNGLVFSHHANARLWLPKKLPYNNSSEYQFEIQSGVLDKDLKAIMTGLTTLKPSDYANAVAKLKDCLRDLDNKGEIPYNQDTGFVIYPIEKLGYVNISKNIKRAELVEREKVRALLSILG